MVKLTGKAKAVFLARMRRGRAAAAGAKAKKVVKRARKTVSKLKIPKRRTKNNNMAKRGALPKRSRRRDTIKALYDKKTMKQIAIKTALGAGIGITIKVLGMVSRNPSAQIIANRAAPTVAAYLGGGTGELVYQGADFILTRGSLNLSNGGNSFNSGGA